MRALVLGSGRSVEQVDRLNLSRYAHVVPVNNAHLAAPSWTTWFRSDDFDGYRPLLGDRPEVTTFSPEVVAALNYYGGADACGLSTVLQASYWLLHTKLPREIHYLGCDMNYRPDAGGRTHFYGVGHDIKQHGIPDPDRMAEFHSGGDPDYIGSVYRRFADVAGRRGCRVYNLSDDPDSRLPFPRRRSGSAASRSRS